MPVTVNLTEAQVLTALRSVLLTFGLTSSKAGQDVPIIKGQVNRVAEPEEDDYVIYWPILRTRLATNIDVYTDNIIAGSIANNVLTVTQVANGSVAIGVSLTGQGVTVGCQIVAQTSGTPGGVGTYTTTTTANVPVGATMYCGTADLTQKTQITIQADVHGPLAADNAQRISTLFRDQFAVDAFNALSLPIAPLYTSDPRQIPFVNGEQQYEERWTIDVVLQADITVITNQQFADQLTATAEAVEAFPQG